MSDRVVVIYVDWVLPFKRASEEIAEERDKINLLERRSERKGKIDSIANFCSCSLQEARQKNGEQTICSMDLGKLELIIV